MKTLSSLLPVAAFALAGCVTVKTTAPADSAEAPAIEEVVVEEMVVEEVPAIEEVAVEEVPTIEDAPAAPAGREPMDMAAIMEAYKAFGTPGEEHKELAATAGKWKTESRMWLSPDQPEPTTITGEITRRMILGGRYLYEEMKGEMMGQPFEGVLILGFNNLDKQYHALWIDSMGTGFALNSGTKDTDGALEMKGMMKDPITPAGRPYRGVMRDIDADTQVMDMYDSMPDGTEWRVMEVTYRRVK